MLLPLALTILAAPARAATELAIGFVDLIGDPRHEDRTGYGRIPLERRGRAHDGALLAMREVAVLGRALGIRFALETARAEDAGGLAAAIGRLRASRGVRFFLVDAPADAVLAAARATRGGAVLLFNVSAEENRLRGADCAPHLMHLAPSTAMRTDALAQYIVARRWRDVLVLEGPTAPDAGLVRSFERSARRFGARIAAKRRFVLGSDPRRRGENNLALLTGGVSYDVVFVADAGGELARFVPYQTLRPRPVIGSAGLTAEAWHWAWERHGGPNLSRRFRRRARRPMRGPDWAAWVGVKAIAEAAARTRSSDFAKLSAHIRGAGLRVDGFKGPALSFRPWDNQLRQPILLATADAVIARAPLPQFLHATQNLDTLGHDRGDSACAGAAAGRGGR